MFVKTPQYCCELKNDATTAAINDQFFAAGGANQLVSNSIERQQ